MGKESKKEWIYVKLIHCAIQQNLTQHCKSTKKKTNILLNGDRVTTYPLRLRTRQSYLPQINQIGQMVQCNQNQNPYILLEALAITVKKHDHWCTKSS